MFDFTVSGPSMLEVSPLDYEFSRHISMIAAWTSHEIPFNLLSTIRNNIILF